MEKEQCEGEVWDNYMIYQCSRKGQYKIGGKWYCWQHKPLDKKKPMEVQIR